MFVVESVTACIREGGYAVGPNNYTGGHETPNKSFWITCLCYHKSAVLCYSPNCVINWFVSPNGPCNQGARVTTRPLLPNGLCHQTACVINRLVSPSGLCHQTVCVTKRPVSPNGACHQTRPSRAARKKNLKLKFALCSRGCFGKRPA